MDVWMGRARSGRNEISDMNVVPSAFIDVKNIPLLMCFSAGEGL